MMVPTYALLASWNLGKAHRWLGCFISCGADQSVHAIRLQQWYGRQDLGVQRGAHREPVPSVQGFVWELPSGQEVISKRTGTHAFAFFHVCFCLYLCTLEFVGIWFPSLGALVFSTFRDVSLWVALPEPFLESSVLYPSMWYIGSLTRLFPFLHVLSAQVPNRNYIADVPRNQWFVGAGLH